MINPLKKYPWLYGAIMGAAIASMVIFGNDELLEREEQYQKLLKAYEELTTQVVSEHAAILIMLQELKHEMCENCEEPENDVTP